MNAAIPEAIEALSYPALIHAGAEKQLISNASKWLEYRHQGHLTSHTDNKDTATQIYHVALEF